jgi:hypothetical protein
LFCINFRTAKVVQTDHKNKFTGNDMQEKGFPVAGSGGLVPRAFPATGNHTVLLREEL